MLTKKESDWIINCLKDASIFKQAAYICISFQFWKLFLKP